MYSFVSERIWPLLIGLDCVWMDLVLAGCMWLYLVVSLVTVLAVTSMVWGPPSRGSARDVGWRLLLQLSVLNYAPKF